MASADQQPSPAAPLEPGVVSREAAADAISPKVGWAAAASALATIAWTLVAALAPNVFSAADIAALTGASATVLAFTGGYFVRDRLRYQP